MQVGFTPNNRAWNNSEANIGLFFVHSYDAPEYSKPRRYFHDGCVPYSESFQEIFIEKDRTWRVARIMAIVAAAAGCLAAFVAWILCVVPAPADCLWPGLLLPAIMIAFIAEGSKFLFFDIALCRSALWFPSGVDSSPTSAESCQLSHSAYAAIVAGSVHLIGLLMVCLKAPEKRELDPDYGIKYSTGAEIDFLEESANNAQGQPYTAGRFPGNNQGQDDGDRLTIRTPNHPSNYPVDHYDEDTSILDEEMYVESHNSADLSDFESEYRYSNLFKPKQQSQDRTVLSDPPKEAESRISKSRLTAMSKIERSTTAVKIEDDDALVEQLVSDLDTSFLREKKECTPSSLSDDKLDRDQSETTSAPSGAAHPNVAEENTG